MQFTRRAHHQSAGNIRWLMPNWRTHGLGSSTSPRAVSKSPLSSSLGKHAIPEPTSTSPTVSGLFWEGASRPQDDGARLDDRARHHLDDERADTPPFDRAADSTAKPGLRVEPEGCYRTWRVAEGDDPTMTAAPWKRARARAPSSVRALPGGEEVRRRRGSSRRATCHPTLRPRRSSGPRVRLCQRCSVTAPGNEVSWLRSRRAEHARVAVQSPVTPAPQPRGTRPGDDPADPSTRLRRRRQWVPGG